MKSKVLIRNSYRLVGVFLLVCTLSLLKGQYSSSRVYDEAAMREYAQQSTFDYMDYTVKPPSIWERISWWLQSMLQEIFLNPNTPWLTKIAYYLVLLVVVGGAVFYILKLRYGGGLTADYQSYRSAGPGISAAKNEDFDPLIREALNEENFKLAIRYLYLRTLVSLSRNEKIQLKEWKSPYDYQKELKGEFAELYQEIAQLFEYIWYGDFDASKEEFRRGDELSKKLEKIK